jgi:hypothetical protein
MPNANLYADRLDLAPSLTPANCLGAPGVTDPASLAAGAKKGRAAPGRLPRSGPP